MKNGILKAAAVFVMAFAVLGLSGIEARQAQAYGTISGYVQDGNGAPIYNVRVEFYNAVNQSYVTSTSTNTSGTYAYSWLNAGDYKVRFSNTEPNKFIVQGLQQPPQPLLVEDPVCGDQEGQKTPPLDCVSGLYRGGWVG